MLNQSDPHRKENNYNMYTQFSFAIRRFDQLPACLCPTNSNCYSTNNEEYNCLNQTQYFSSSHSATM